MKFLIPLKTKVIIASFLVFFACDNHKNKSTNTTEVPHKDEAFVQEYHEGFPFSDPSMNDVRGIAVDKESNVWIATRSGIFAKQAAHNEWKAIITVQKDKGPGYDVKIADDGTVWLGTWNALYSYSNNTLKKHSTPAAPISKICIASEGVYALGPKGIWYSSDKGNLWNRQNYNIARSVRDVLSDNNGGLWVATDVGLYHCKDEKYTLYHNTDELISCYTNGLSFDPKGKLWVAGLGGITIRDKHKKQSEILPNETGVTTADVTTVRLSPNETMWVGSQVGITRFYADGTKSVRFSKRWLVNDEVRDIAFDSNGNAWIATAGGVSAIKRRMMTLEEKADYFHDVLEKRHFRAPFVSVICVLPTPGDVSEYAETDTDNDGMRTGMLLATESFRYAVTKKPQAKENADKAFAMLKYFQEVTETEGFFARTIVPSSWNDNVHDRNRTYTPQQIADELVKNPRHKPVENRWRISKDGKWFWKGDTSSDEMCGHMMGYYFYYEYAATEEDKKHVRNHVKRIVDYLILHDYNFVDIDGSSTKWGVWSPEQLNRDPEWIPEKPLNSLEMLAYLKLAYHMTEDEKYQNEYLRLRNEEHYFENAKPVLNPNPAFYTYIDANLASHVLPILLKCEKDPKLKKEYEDFIDIWFEDLRKHDKYPFYNLIYCYSRDKMAELDNTIAFLQDTPLDLISWTTNQTIREDVKLVRSPVLDGRVQTHILLPPSERSEWRSNNPWGAVKGNNGRTESKPTFWLFPYWMARHMKMIQ